MVNKKMNPKRNSFIIFLRTASVIFFIYLFFSFFNIQENIIDRTKESFFVQMVNYAMPITQTVNFHTQKSQNTNSMERNIFNYMGISLSHPDEILKREISYLNINEDSIKEGTPAIGDFNLSDNDVIKNDSNNTNGNNGNSSSESRIINAYDPSLKEILDNSKPEVLIYHSHTTESYGSDGQDNMDPNKNVIAVGNSLTNTLENDYGISVIHDTTVHNALSYDNSYVRAGQTVDTYLQKYGGFKMIIDLDRASDINEANVTKTINGLNVAKFTFVMAKNNSHLNDNMFMVNLLLKYTNNYFPGLTMGNGINYFDNGSNSFNQDKSNNAFLLEIGSSPNSIDESKATTQYVARIIAEYLNNENFIAAVAPYAQDTYKKDKIFPSVTLAQAMLESAEGTSELTKQANNLFGIKAFNWSGKTVSMPTRENYNGKNVVIMGKFRAYNNWGESIEDHGNFLVSNSIYSRHGVFSASSYAAQAKALQSSGYATDPNYANELIGLIQEYNLNQYDNIH